MVSAPAPPSRMLLPPLPVMVLARLLPVPLMLAVPVRVRFSTLAPERVGDRRLHRVGAFADGFRHHIAGVVDDVGVVAGAADHGVGARAAVERVVADAAGEHVDAAVAGDDVVEVVAGAVDIGAAGQGQVLDVGAKRVAGGRLHGVGAFVERSPSPRRRRCRRCRCRCRCRRSWCRRRRRHRACRCRAAAEHVDAAVAGDDVVEGVAGAVDVGGAGQGQVLDIGAERVGGRRLDGVGAFVERSRSPRRRHCRRCRCRCRGRRSWCRRRRRRRACCCRCCR